MRGSSRAVSALFLRERKLAYIYILLAQRDVMITAVCIVCHPIKSGISHTYTHTIHIITQNAPLLIEYAPPHARRTTTTHSGIVRLCILCVDRVLRGLVYALIEPICSI